MVQSKNNIKKDRIRYYFITICLLICFILIMFYYKEIDNIHKMEMQETKKINELKNQFDIDMGKSVNDPSDNDITCINISDDPDIDKNINSDNNNTIFNNTDNSGKKQSIYEDCIIEIPDINLSKIVYSGIDREKKLDEYDLITAASDMKFSNGGNYIICGHASRLYGHSLNRLREVHKGTLIRIWAKYGVDEYEVKKVYFDNMDNTSDYCKQTDANEITIVSCAKYISVNSYIIVKAIKK